jgi:hypothetical protein
LSGGSSDRDVIDSEDWHDGSHPRQPGDPLDIFAGTIAARDIDRKVSRRDGCGECVSIGRQNSNERGQRRRDERGKNRSPDEGGGPSSGV